MKSNDLLRKANKAEFAKWIEMHPEWITKDQTAPICKMEYYDHSGILQAAAIYPKPEKGTKVKPEYRVRALAFSPMAGNSKLKKLQKQIKGKGYTISLRSGITCPGAAICLSWAKRNKTGKAKIVQKGPIRCFGASDETQYDATYDQREYNTRLIKSLGADALKIGALIMDSIKILIKPILVRVHVGGDYFSEAYLRGWIMAAFCAPKIHFYSYTKSATFVVNVMNDSETDIPDNFQIVFSEGGKHDFLIPDNGRRAVIVGSQKEADDLNLQVDHDDSLAAFGDIPRFALLIHGTQTKGSVYAKQSYQNRKAPK